MGLADIFKSKEYKRKINELTVQNERLSEDVAELKNVQMSIQQMSLMDIEIEITKKKNHIIMLESKIEDLDTEINRKQVNIIASEEKLRDLEKQLMAATDDIIMESYGLYRPKYDFATALGYKDKLADIRNKQKEFIKTNKAVNFNENWTVNGSKTEGRKMTKDNIKIMLRAFNNECEAAINKVKYSNVEVIRNRIHNSYEQINKLNSVNKCSITNAYYKLKIEELYLAYEYERKKEEEREALRAQREKEREDKVLQKEIENKKKLIDKDIKHIKNVIDELELKLLTASDKEQETLAAQIHELKENLIKYEEDKEELDYRLLNASAGYVYIISNIGSFGQDVFKIGVTRRLDPFDRIAELSSASVPFKFDIHALIFSYDAYKLESDLHAKFDKCRINRVNNRKEFFKLPLSEIKKELERLEDLTVDFKDIADAEEYREGLKTPEI